MSVGQAHRDFVAEYTSSLCFGRLGKLIAAVLFECLVEEEHEVLQEAAELSAS